MKNSWVKGLDVDEVSDIESNFKASAVIRRRLTDILKDKIEVSNKNARNKTSYDNPNWAYLQADNVGYERALYEIIDLLSQ